MPTIVKLTQDEFKALVTTVANKFKDLDDSTCLVIEQTRTGGIGVVTEVYLEKDNIKKSESENITDYSCW